MDAETHELINELAIAAVDYLEVLLEQTGISAEQIEQHLANQSTDTQEEPPCPPNS